MTDDVNPEMIVLAREFRGLTQTELARALGVSQSKISKYESELLPVGDDLGQIANALGFPVSFFRLRDRRIGPGVTSLFHRRQKSIGVKQMRKVHATIDVIRMQLARLLRGVDVESGDGFVPMDVDRFDGDVEQIARLVRAAWGLPPGPIRNLVERVEDEGGIVLATHLGEDRVDAVGLAVDGLPPLFFTNPRKPGCRQRWTLAHEVGHMIMHQVPSNDVESEADRFAAEFLLPAREIKHELRPPLTLRKLANLKHRWKVSMQALAWRARKLEMITERQYRRIMVEMSRQGWRRAEPVTIPAEQPRFVTDMIEAYSREQGYSIQDIARAACARVEEFRAMYLAPNTHLRIA